MPSISARYRSFSLLLSITLVTAGCSKQTPPAGSGPNDTSTTKSFAFPDTSLSGSAYVTARTGLTAEQQASGTIALFDGESLFGWQEDKVAGNWRVEDGAIACDEGKAELLLTSVPFADFELTLDFKIDADGNSGVFVRTAEKIGSVATDTYEVNIAASHPNGFTTGSLVDRLKASGVNAGDDGEWHSMRIVCDGSRIQTFVDGEDAADLLQTEDSPGNRKAGYIGLQHRIGGVAFRRVFLTPLNLTQQFDDGIDRWKLAEARLKDGTIAAGAEFNWSDGGVDATGGLAFLESEETYQDFVVQLTAKTNAKDVNSGLFFRAEKSTPEAPSNGYELQIHNGFDGERTKPANGGTGGIFRRREARVVTSDDLAPTTVTLIAHGDHFVSWNNGYPVLDWVDERADDPNPRRGKRLDAGHLSIQAHDPTTNVRISKLGISEYPTD